MTLLNHIIQWVVRYPPALGGVEKAVASLSQTFHKAFGMNCYILTTPIPKPAMEKQNGVTIYRQPPYRLSKVLTQLYQSRGPTILHLHYPTLPFLFLGFRAGKKLNFPMVITFHNDMAGNWWKSMFKPLWYHYIAPKIFQHMQAIILPQPSLQAICPALKPWSSKIYVIPWGVDLDRFQPSPFPETDTFHIGFLGVLDHHHNYKGLPYLIEAFRQLKSQGKRIKLWIGGTGNREGWYRQKVAQMELHDAVVFLGRIDEEKLAQFYQSCHLFCLPTIDPRREGFGLVALEALACGRPVLVTPYPAVAPAVERSTLGSVVPPKDVEALVEAITYWMEHREALMEAGIRAREYAEANHPWKRIAEQYLDIYQNYLYVA